MVAIWQCSAVRDQMLGNDQVTSLYRNPVLCGSFIDPTLVRSQSMSSVASVASYTVKKRAATKTLTVLESGLIPLNRS